MSETPQPQRILIIGATSGMGLEIARLHAQRGDALYLMARDADELRLCAGDCTVRGAAAVHVGAFDLAQTEAPQQLLAVVLQQLGVPQRIYLCAATAADYPDFYATPQQVQQVFAVNAAGSINMLNAFLPALYRAGESSIVGVSSVAALKGKGNNPVYSASKAALNVYLEGLRNGFGGRGLHVLSVYPGFTDTSLTWGMDGLMFLQHPRSAAEAIVAAADRKKDKLYTPRIWQLIMLIMMHLPDFIYKKKPFVTDDELKRLAESS